MELAIIIVVTLVTVPLVLLTEGALRVALGVAFLIFFPGYSLFAALFPRRGSLQSVERIALSFVLSMAIVPLICLALNFMPWGITLHPIVISITIFILIASAIALYRRRRLLKEERFEPELHLRLPPWPTLTRTNKVLAAVLLLSICGAAAMLTYVATTPRSVERFSEFYILGSEGMAEDYPHEAVVGQSVQIPLGIVNQEHEYTTYRVEVTIDGDRLQEIGPIELAHKGVWEGDVTLIPMKAGADQKVEFLLYVGEQIDPYLTLHLWLDVKEAT